MKLVYLFIFLIGCGFGHLTLSQSWDGRVFFKSVADPRLPAAFDQAMDLTRLQGYSLEMAQKKQLIKAHRLQDLNGEISFQLGNFVYEPSEGTQAFICNEYDEIELVFLAEGMAVSGTRPKMTIVSKCMVDGNSTYLSPIFIPYETILSFKAEDQRFDYYTQYNADILFTNVSMVWPTSWSLDSVRIYNSHTLREGVYIQNSEIIEFNGHPLVINW
ncbi:MAG: hypothetical protein MK008_03425 [Bdellovibrionales bacterium]|nr:hypothetical protein [Bdellovibrionales bacterium]